MNFPVGPNLNLDESTRSYLPDGVPPLPPNPTEPTNKMLDVQELPGELKRKSGKSGKRRGGGKLV
ncbi:hypothetical protein FRC11_005831 [Ceratobasidium sp. 423]|nr:hypothetical protein FRC11_005831 [Ceratobasidium sp. 423]